jgi:hypothetical protein
MSWDYENYEIDSNNEHIQITHNHKLIFHSIDVEDEIHFMFADIENYLL